MSENDEDECEEDEELNEINADGSPLEEFYGTNACSAFTPLDFESIFQEEQDLIDALHSKRAPDGRRAAPFSLAFSGGGIRAAAFQAGVLWRLAVEDHLKDVDIFAAVSGGGYITSAFASHCLAAGRPEQGNVKDWYKEVVAETMLRMQRNAGNFIRDCVKIPGFPEDGAGHFPRFCDGPILLMTIVCSVAVNPIAFVVCVLVPFTIIIELYFAASMRAAFCAPDDSSWVAIYSEYSPFQSLVILVCVCILANFVVYLLRHVVPSCKFANSKDPRRVMRASIWAMIGYALDAFLKRFTWALLIMCVFLFAVPFCEWNIYHKERRLELCLNYVEAQTERHRAGTRYACSDMCAKSDVPWWLYATDGFNYTASWIVGNYTQVLREFYKDENTPVEETTYQTARGINTYAFSIFSGMTLVIFGLSVLILPIVGSEIFLTILAFLGPALLLFTTVSFAQYTVYGPITKNAMGIFAYDDKVWGVFVSTSLLIALVITPLHALLRSWLHRYYKRTLYQNFFESGQDRSFSALTEALYCPFIILTGTASDFKLPGRETSITEFSFSPLHVGSRETGYRRMPDYRSLAKCTAITGAAGVDAISLSMSQTLSMRFWLEVLNLSWGDFIIFSHMFAREGAPPNGVWSCIVRWVHQLPSEFFLLCVFSIFFVAWNFREDHDCSLALGWAKRAASMALAIMAFSFLFFLPPFDLLSLSPLIRQLHQATRYRYVGHQPPRMLYVTDGGVNDCTAIGQLLRRRRERILLVLAAADPNDELGVLLAALREAQSLRLATFYDPENPRNDLRILFEQFKEDHTMLFMHIGISYCWNDDAAAIRELPLSLTGRLIIVKNRLPEGFENQPVRPLLTEEEILQGYNDATADSDFEAEGWGEMTTDQLGFFGCCDCCHLHGCNCGPKFPHGSGTGYLYLTPQICSSLMRLGFDVCHEAVQKVTSIEE